MKPAAERGNKISGEELMGARLVKLQAGTSNLFASLFRTMLSELMISPAIWDQLMNHWLNDPRNRIGSSDRARGAARRRLNAQLRQRNMTPYVFMKAMRFLNPVSADLQLKVSCTWPNGLTTEHTARHLNFLS